MSSWQQTAKEKRDAVLALIPPQWRINTPTVEEQQDVREYIRQFLSAEEDEITESPATAILEKTIAGQWTAVQVAEAFCHRAALAHQLTNCLHEIFFDAAIQDAKRTDEYLAQHGRPIGPLHGLPVSLKDQFHVRGVETHMGYVGWIGTFQGEKGTGKERVFESELVRELRQLGATLYCKTAVPQSLMCGETVNNIIGYTPNPSNRQLSAGGSSGGEGALISLRGSPLGLGTDIGGSVRIPAAFNGLYGLKPSSGRLPYQGMANSYDGQNSILSVIGPLARTAQDLRLLVMSVLSTEPWLHDPLVVNLPWRPQAEQVPEHLSFGIMVDDGTCTPHPPVVRALRTIVDLVESLGHETLDWRPSVPHAELVEVCGQVWDFDGGADARRAYALSGESPAPQVLSLDTEPVDATTIMRVNVRKRQLQKQYMDYWNSTAEASGTGRPVDAIVCPLAPFAAARPNEYTYYGFSNFVNVLDYTAVVIPVTTADKTIDVRRSFEPLSEIDKETYDTYDAELYHGSPVCVQLVGRRHEEEKMIALAELLSDALSKRS